MMPRMAPIVALILAAWTPAQSEEVEGLAQTASQLAREIVAFFPQIDGVVLEAGREGLSLSVGRDSGAAPGTLMAAMRSRERWKHPTTGEELGPRWEVVGMVRIKDVSEGVSSAELLQGQAERGDRISSSALRLRMDVKPFERQGPGDPALSRLLTDLVREDLERSGRFEMARGGTGQGTEQFALEGRVADAVATVIIHAKLVRQPEGRAIGFWTFSLASTPAIRSLLEGDLGPRPAFALIGETPLTGRGLCQIIPGPASSGTHSVLVLSQDGIEAVQSDGQWVRDALARWTDAPQRDLALGRLIAVDPDGDGQETILVKRRVGDAPGRVEAGQGARWPVQDLDLFPLLCCEESGGRLLLLADAWPERNYFQASQVTARWIGPDWRDAGKMTLPSDFFDVCQGEVLQAGTWHWILAESSGTLAVFDRDGALVWRSPEPFGCRVASWDWDGNGLWEIATSSPEPLGSKDWIEILEWDGRSFAEKWRSDAMEGSVMGLCASDIDRDERRELVVAMERSTGSPSARLLVFAATGTASGGPVLPGAFGESGQIDPTPDVEPGGPAGGLP